jgi:AcrR family transcriptional regulator
LTLNFVVVPAWECAVPKAPVTSKSRIRTGSRHAVKPSRGGRAAVARTPRSATRASAQAAPRWQRRKAERPGEILAAALQQFVEHGYASTRLADVARRAGVTKGTMYRYFDSKEALFKAVVRESVIPLVEAFESEVARADADATKLLIAFGRNWMEHVYRQPVGGLAKLITAEAANFPELARFYHTEVIDRTVKALRSVLERGIARGEFRPMDVDSAVRVLRSPLILTTIWKYSMLKCETAPVDDERFLETYLDMMLRGVLVAREVEAPHA